MLAQPVCASSAERNWSWSVYVYGMFNQDGRVLAYEPRDRANKRVYCHEALHLKEKLQSAGSKQKTVGWDTDEASDASTCTTEADLAVYYLGSTVYPPPVTYSLCGGPK